VEKIVLVSVKVVLVVMETVEITVAISVAAVMIVSHLVDTTVMTGVKVATTVKEVVVIRVKEVVVDVRMFAIHRVARLVLLA
jgi:hypothetical protein